MTVAETTGAKTLDRMIEIGRELRDQDGAEAVIMCCAGTARHRRPLEAARARQGEYIRQAARANAR
jgi:hypothetical protein